MADKKGINKVEFEYLLDTLPHPKPHIVFYIPVNPDV
jgi:hypothetical protein